MFSENPVLHVAMDVKMDKIFKILSFRNYHRSQKSLFGVLFSDRMENGQNIL
jgi:hypothetical protein